MSNSPQYICIEGNIGAGKTTLCQKINQLDECKLILEEFVENPFLQYFYNEPERYALTVELFFLTERHKQLKTELLNPELFVNYYLADYCQIKSLLFAKNNLKNEEEFKLYHKLYTNLAHDYRKPDRILYIHRPISKIIRQIKERGRTYELDIKAEYLKSIEEMYFQYFQAIPDTPCLILNCENADYLNNKNHFDQIYKLLHSPVDPGIHHFTIE